MACDPITTLANACAANLADLQANVSALATLAKSICEGSQPAGAIGQTLLVNYSSNGVASAYTTPVVTGAANSLLLAFVINGVDTAMPSIPSFTGGGLTWTQIQTIANSSSNPRLTVFRAFGVPTTGAFVADFSGQSQDGCLISVVQYTNVNPSGVGGAGAIAQAQVAGPVTGAVASMVMGALDPSGKNACVFVAVRSGNPFSGTPKVGWTKLVDAGVASLGHGVGYGYWLGSRLATTDNTPMLNCPFTSWMAMGIEIKAV
jgi:hypothetical protein